MKQQHMFTQCHLSTLEYISLKLGPSCLMDGYNIFSTKQPCAYEPTMCQFWLTLFTDIQSFPCRGIDGLYMHRWLMAIDRPLPFHRYYIHTCYTFQWARQLCFPSITPDHVLKIPSRYTDPNQVPTGAYVSSFTQKFCDLQITDKEPLEFYSNMAKPKIEVLSGLIMPRNPCKNLLFHHIDGFDFFLVFFCSICELSSPAV